MLKILKIKNNNLKKIIEATAMSIRGGEVIVFPTDTVYGLICDATNKEAVAKIFKIKKRGNKKALPIFVKDMKMAKELAEVNGAQEKLLKKSWPGKITFILKRKKGKIKIYGVKEKTIGLRIPHYKLINMLMDKVKKPMVGTSANLAENPSSTEIEEIIRQFKDQKYQPDLIIDAKNLIPSKPSTIIDLTGKKIKIIRQ
ncbi:MAG: L-threonylcarbamoyladenylate synthase [bacterium]|nr:L-threonylcarbamoyladenylate synthase [bacterium]